MLCLPETAVQKSPLATCATNVLTRAKEITAKCCRLHGWPFEKDAQSAEKSRRKKSNKADCAAASIRLTLHIILLVTNYQLWKLCGILGDTRCNQEAGTCFCYQLALLQFAVAEQDLKQLQSVQYAVAPLVTETLHITAVLKSLHWLPVCQCSQYRIAMLLQKCLNRRAPQYLIRDCSLDGRRSGHSAGRQVLEVWNNTAFDDRSFAAAKCLERSTRLCS